MVSFLELLKLIILENLHYKELQRRPEPTLIMENHENVSCFHEQGANNGALLPIYHFNALAISALLPYQGTVVDLGSGSGQFLCYLAKCRPDCRIVGVDLSEQMVNLGNKLIRELGLSANVCLNNGDMTQFNKHLCEKVDLVSSVFSLHHLPSFEDLHKCLEDIGNLRSKTGCGVWLFDHARPRSKKSSAIFPEIFTPKATTIFKKDSTNSLLASFSFIELSKCIDEISMGSFNHELSRILRLYQIHWLIPKSANSSNCPIAPQKQILQIDAFRAFNQLSKLFRKVPFMPNNKKGGI